MPIVKAQCTSCGGTLDVDNSKDAAICPFCNTPYIVEKAIQQFNINNTNYIQNAVFYNTKESEAELLKRGIKQLELNVWKDAGDTFRQMTKLYPENYKGWLGLCIVNANLPEQDYDTDSLRKNAVSQCPDNQKDELSGAIVRSGDRIQALTDSINECNTRIERMERSVGHLKDSIKKNERENTIQIILLIAASIGALICIGMLTDDVSKGIIALIIDGAIWYFLYQYSLGKNGKWRNFSNENRQYAWQIMGCNKKIEFEESLLENLQSQLREEEQGKESTYFINLMKM